MCRKTSTLYSRCGCVVHEGRVSPCPKRYFAGHTIREEPLPRPPFCPKHDNNVLKEDRREHDVELGSPLAGIVFAD
jgi:hypothetical protein